MSVNIEFVAEMAGVAEAAYANFDSGLGAQRSLTDSGFSDTQATEFLVDWAVVDHLQDDPESDSSATLLRSNADDTSAIAFRGVAGIVDDFLYADLGDIVHDGLAVDQVADFYILSSCCLERRMNTNSMGAAA